MTCLPSIDFDWRLHHQGHESTLGRACTLGGGDRVGFTKPASRPCLAAGHLRSPRTFTVQLDHLLSSVVAAYRRAASV